MTKIINNSECKRVRLLLLFPSLILLTVMCTKTVYEDSISGQQEIQIPTRATRLPDGSFREAHSTEESDIYFVVEDMPDFQGGGQIAFRDYITENLNYPENAIKKNIEGRVFVQFVVTAEGNVDDVKIVRGIDPLLDQEALRVTMASPKWTPGRQNGKPVSVVFTYPITFKMTESETP